MTELGYFNIRTLIENLILVLYEMEEMKFFRPKFHFLIFHICLQMITFSFEIMRKIQWYYSLGKSHRRLIQFSCYQCTIIIDSNTLGMITKIICFCQQIQWPTSGIIERKLNLGVNENNGIYRSLPQQTNKKIRTNNENKVKHTYTSHVTITV